MTQLQAGDMAPDFTSVTQDGQPFTKADLMGQRTILYFYPKDNTSGCTLEAKSLRDGRAELARMGFRIIGVSPDSEKSHRNFCAKHDLNFTLLADTDHSVCEAYGVWAASTWACCARPSSSTPRGGSKRYSPRSTPQTTTGKSWTLTNRTAPTDDRHEILCGHTTCGRQPLGHLAASGTRAAGSTRA